MKQHERLVALGLILFGGLLQMALLVPSATESFFPSQKIVLREVPELVPVLKQPSIVTATDSSQILAEPLPTTAQGVVVMDLTSGVVLYEKNAHQPLYPASTVKLMTALVVLDTYSLDDIVTVGPETIVDGSTIGFVPGEQLYVRELLYGLLLQSGNDAAHILANHHPLYYDGFINDMNQKTAELGLEGSYFLNPSGLDHPEQLTTARDLSIIAREVMKDEYLKQVVGTKKRVILDVTGTQAHVIGNTNSFLHQEPGVIGLKTGTTPLAGQNLVTQLERDGHSILIVMLGSQDRYNETKNLIDWVFDSHDWVSWTELIH